MKVSLVSVTKPENPLRTAEDTIVYCARVSNPANQDKPGEKLIKYCIKHGHWSVFEMVDMTVEIETSRAISAQIIRHKSFSFQEFSQRYAEVQSFEPNKPRRQDTKNRQSSLDDLDSETLSWYYSEQAAVRERCLQFYKECLDRGIAKESARFDLPVAATTRIYMKGSVRSWITYFQTRCAEDTQLEHREIALAIRDTIFKTLFPTIYAAITEQHETTTHEGSDTLATTLGGNGGRGHDIPLPPPHYRVSANGHKTDCP